MAEIKTKSGIDLKSTKRTKAIGGMPDAASNVDVEAGILKKVLLCKAGFSKGHSYYLPRVDILLPLGTDQSFIDSLETLSKSMGEQEMKARFGHPSMSEETLGKHCGRVFNIIKEGDAVYGDIKLLKAAAQSPSGDLYNYILSIAQEDPSAIMMSISFYPGKCYAIGPDGQRLTEGEYGFSKDDQLTIKKWPEENQVIYESVVSWPWTDFVHEGALTDSLFKSIGKAPLAVKATRLLDENIELRNFLLDNPEAVEGFMQKYTELRSKNLPPKKMKKNSFFASLMQKAGKLLGSVSFKAIGAKTDTDVAITILTDSEKPAVGDSVVLTDSEEPAPAGDHKIAEGDLAGYTITTDANGVITAIVEPAPEAPAADPANDSTEIKSLKESHKALAKSVADLAVVVKSTDAKLQQVLSSPVGKSILNLEGDKVTPPSGESKKSAMTPWEEETERQKKRFPKKD